VRSPEVVAAIARLREKGVLSEPVATALAAPARGDLLSVRNELRVLLYGGVLLVTAGVGIFLQENHRRLGPALIASLIGAFAALCLLYAWKRSAPFSWERAASPHVASDYLLLLSMLLFGSDLAYVETQFRLLGPRWPYHLLVVAVLCLAAAYRFDSRAVLTLALTSFAAWRGVAVGWPGSGPGGSAASAVRANAIVCGVLYVALGALSVRARRKAHFEAVWVAAGLLLMFGGILPGALLDSGAWPLWEAVLAIVSAAVIAVAYRLRRPLDFAIALAAVYVGGLRALAELVSGASDLLFIALWSVAVLGVLITATRRMRRAA